MPENAPPKLPKLEAFKAIQKCFAVAGISPKLAIQSHPFNGRILFGFLILGTAITFLSVYISSYAETFLEYTQLLYTASTVVLIVLALIILIVQVNEVFGFMNRCDTMLNTSK